MALAMLGSLAQKLLPEAITWGIGKLRQTSFGNGLGNKVAQIGRVMQKPMARKILKTIQKAKYQQPDDQGYQQQYQRPKRARKRKMITKAKNMQQRQRFDDEMPQQNIFEE